MNGRIADVLGAFAIEFQQDVAADRDRQRSRADLIQRARLTALAGEADARRSSAIAAAAGSSLGGVASAIGGAKEVTEPLAKGEFGDLSVDARSDLTQASKVLGKSAAALTQASRFGEGLERDRDERARSLGELAAEGTHSRAGLDHARGSIDRQESAADQLLARAKKG